MKKVTVFGAGLLVGTALAVIIPEGIRSLFSSHRSDSNHMQHSHPLNDNSISIENEESSSIDAHSVIGISLVLGTSINLTFKNNFYIKNFLSNSACTVFGMNMLLVITLVY